MLASCVSMPTTSLITNKGYARSPAALFASVSLHEGIMPHSLFVFFATQIRHQRIPLLWMAGIASPLCRLVRSTLGNSEA